MTDSVKVSPEFLVADDGDPDIVNVDGLTKTIV